MGAEYPRPHARQRLLLSQQPNKGACHNKDKKIRTWVTKRQERTGINNTDNVQTEMTQTIINHTALEIVDVAGLRQDKVFSSHKKTSYDNNGLSPLN